MAANGLVLVRIAYNIIVVSIPYKRVRAKCIALSAVVQDAFLLNIVLNNYIGSKSTWDNLRIIPKDKMPKLTPLHESDRQVLLEGLDGVISQTLQDKIWEMIWKRWCAYEDFCNSR